MGAGALEGEGGVRRVAMFVCLADERPLSKYSFIPMTSKKLQNTDF